MRKFILDMCCGPKMMWFDKQHKNTVYCDYRIEKKGFLPSRPNREVLPDIVSNFTSLPFSDNTFHLVVMDPPHMHSAGERCILTMNYGKLNKDTWGNDIRKGVEEAYRVLKDYGILIFKWNETQIKRKDVLKAINKKPLFGHSVMSKTHTHWFCFMKHETTSEDNED